MHEKRVGTGRNRPGLRSMSPFSERVASTALALAWRCDVRNETTGLVLAATEAVRRMPRNLSDYTSAGRRPQLQHGVSRVAWDSAKPWLLAGKGAMGMGWGTTSAWSHWERRHAECRMAHRLPLKTLSGLRYSFALPTAACDRNVTWGHHPSPTTGVASPVINLTIHRLACCRCPCKL